MEKHSIKNILTWKCMFWHFARDKCWIYFLNHRLTIVEKNIIKMTTEAWYHPIIHKTYVLSVTTLSMYAPIVLKFIDLTSKSYKCYLNNNDFQNMNDNTEINQDSR